MDPKFLKDHDEKFFYDFISHMTDKEIIEKNLYYQQQQLEKLKSIKNNVQFFFYLIVIGAVITFISINK